MSVGSIICTVKKFLKVAAADEVPFVRDRIELSTLRFSGWWTYADSPGNLPPGARLHGRTALAMTVTAKTR
jgi:hypothetical protein